MYVVFVWILECDKLQHTKFNDNLKDFTSFFSLWWKNSALSFFNQKIRDLFPKKGCTLTLYLKVTLITTCRLMSTAKNNKNVEILVSETHLLRYFGWSGISSSHYWSHFLMIIFFLANELYWKIAVCLAWINWNMYSHFFPCSIFNMHKIYLFP